MHQQTFVVILEVPADLAHCFPKIEAGRMANIICDGFVAKSCSFMGPVPFTITCRRVDESALVSGRMKEYPSEEFGEPEKPVFQLLAPGSRLTN